MKIAIFSDTFYPEISGITDSALPIAIELAKRGNKIRFYVPSYSEKNYRIVGQPKENIELGPNIEVHRLFSLPFPSGTHQARFVLPSFWIFLFVKKFKPDIIQTHLFAGVGLEALMLGKFNKIPIIGTDHTAISEFIRYSPIKSKWFKNLVFRYVSWFYNKCDFVTAPSPSVILEMENHGFKNKSKVISNPVDTLVFKPCLKQNKKELKSEFGFSDNTIIYAGRLAPEKNIDVLIHALLIVRKKYPNTILVLAGHGSAYKDLKDLAKKLDLESNVKFLGTVDKMKLSKLYQASEIFVMSSMSEVQSMSLLQAMACGLPSIVVRARSHSEYYTNEENGFLIKPNDINEFANKIILLFDKPTLRKKLGDNALLLSKEISVPKIADLWEKTYHDVINKKIESTG
mgnify:CR=1 FL=1